MPESACLARAGRRAGSWCAFVQEMATHHGSALSSLALYRTGQFSQASGSMARSVEKYTASKIAIGAHFNIVDPSRTPKADWIHAVVLDGPVSKAT